MFKISHLLLVVEAFCEAEGIEETTLSHRMFRDSKKIRAMRQGADLGTQRFNTALVYLSRNWPDKTVWPDCIPRPFVSDPQPTGRQDNG